MCDIVISHNSAAGRLGTFAFRFHRAESGDALPDVESLKPYYAKLLKKSFGAVLESGLCFSSDVHMLVIYNRV